jgi:NAD(P)H-hydrate epimerase
MPDRSRQRQGPERTEATHVADQQPPPVYVLSRDDVRAVDQKAVETYGMPSIILMENAARALAEQAMRMLRKRNRPEGPVLIICGSGNNGGDGWALARHLHNHGVNVTIVPLKDPREGSDAAVNANICRTMKLREASVEELDAHRGAALIVDALFGTGLDRAIEGEAAEIVEWINNAGRPVLAVDAPSGLDVDTGEPLGPCVQATATVTFVGPKPGFDELECQRYVGEVIVGDIGAPRELVEELGTKIELTPSQSHRRGPS